MPNRNISSLHDALQALGASKKRIRLLLDSTAEAIYGLDTDGRCTFANAACARILGYDSPEAFIGRDMHELIHFQHEDGSRYPVTECTIYKAFQLGRRYHGDDEVLWRKDGTAFPAEVWSYPMTEDDEVLGAVVTFLDITDRRRAEQRLEEALKEAESANRAKSEFLANMSHEIRTPMTAILGYADLVLATSSDQAVRDYVDTIKRNGGYLLEILNDILDLSKIEAGGLELQTERVEPQRILAEIRSLMSIRAQEKALELDITFDTALPETIETDSVRLRQVLVNLVGNAIKFTDQGSVTVRVALTEGAHPKLVFHVEDTGIGMDADQRERIFEPFTQLQDANSRQRAGTGLGLPICQRLVGMLGGELWVDSKLGEGSTFSFTIDPGPVDEVARVEPTVGLTAPSEPLALEQERLDARILVVDDHRDIRQLAKFYLEQVGAEVDLANTGAEALETVRQAAADSRPFDLILMDMQMPALDGFEATRRLRRQGYDVPIIALTAAAMEHDRNRCLEAGCSAHVAKPIDADFLISVVEEHLAGAEPEQPGHLDKEDDAVDILLVEDNPDVRDATKELLEMKGYRVFGAANGREALEAAEVGAYDVYLVDLTLPDMSGYELLERFLDQPADGRPLYVALSGRGSPDDMRRSREAGFAHHLVKPASLAVLEEVLPSVA